MGIPESMHEELHELGRARDGIILTSELRASGWPEPTIRQAVGALHRLVRGAYTAEVRAEPAERHSQLARAVVLTHPFLALSHLSAAAVWDLPAMGPPPTNVQAVRVGPRVHGWRNPSGIRVHGQPIADVDIVSYDGLRVTTVSRTVVDCARVLGHREAVTIADAATHRGLATTRELRRHVYGMVGWKGVGNARRMLDDVDPRSESPGETWSRLMVRQLGYPVKSQVEVRVDGRFVARVDLLLEGLWVVIEYDGQDKYWVDGTPDHAFMAEKQRHDALVMAGYEVVRLTAADLRDPHRVDRLISEAIARATRRHPAA